jgi:hypothetical protein
MKLCSLLENDGTEDHVKWNMLDPYVSCFLSPVKNREKQTSLKGELLWKWNEKGKGAGRVSKSNRGVNMIKSHYMHCMHETPLYN